jgi:hypothetical protein
VCRWDFRIRPYPPKKNPQCWKREHSR